jgi:hypothetical protein
VRGEVALTVGLGWSVPRLGFVLLVFVFIVVLMLVLMFI